MNSQSSTNNECGRLILVRHTQVEQRFKGICYGASDVMLSTDGQKHARELGPTLANENPDIIMHSGLSRAQFLADEVAKHAAISTTHDTRLVEMSLGSWEMRPWDDIFDEVGHDMKRLIEEPETYCAPDGETAFEVRDRMLSWLRDLPTGKTIVAIGHGAAISTLRGTLAKAHSSKWPDLMPKFGETTHIPLPCKI